MSLRQQLDELVAQWDLNKHPFYQEWRAGTLPLTTLCGYAEEYGQIVRLMPQPWELLGDAALAEEEREHELLWGNFARGLETVVPAHSHKTETLEVLAVIGELFSERCGAIGALYAFEVQQPQTASSKLAGLREFYPQLDPELYTPYFEVHSRNYHESEALAEMMLKLTPEEQAQAVAGCERMCRALWDMLSGIHGAEACAA